jgi:formylglycine-generating enzyme required for sulfatase activity
MAVGWIAFGCAPDSRDPDACSADADCGVLEICDSGACVVVECKVDSDCAAGERCVDHGCQAEQGCVDDGDCAAPTPRCDAASGECVECLDAADCGAGQQCAHGACTAAGCVDDGDCAAPTPRCDAASGACVECLDAADCGAGQQCAHGACTAAGCVDDGDCAAPTPRCDAASGACVECLDAADCGAGQQCAHGACTAAGCVDDGDCAAPTPRCDAASGACVECLDAADCAEGQICSGGVCAAEPMCENDDQCEIGQICIDGDCVTGCRSQRDCPPAQQCVEALGAHGRCVDCEGDGDCDPGWICQDHVCVPYCTSHEHCAPAYCDLESHQCVECIEDAHCDREAGLICRAQACVPGCRVDDDCPDGFCDQASAGCVDCLNNDHCSLGQVCVDDQCVVGCQTDRDCPDGRLCDPEAGAHGRCVECLGDDDCDAAYVCRDGLCEFHCADDGDCAAPTPACDAASGTCVACTGDGHCGAGQVCVDFQCLPGCDDDGDCPPDQVCDPNLGTHGSCVDCLGDADCPPGFACQAKRCVAEGEQTVRIPTGVFVRGSDAGEGDADERPERSILLPTFYIDRTEVTNEQYRACVQAGGCTEPFEMSAYNDPEKARHPVTYITWSQAADYCAWKGMELPTEARWERAARGAAPDERDFPWGAEAASCARANYSGCIGGTDRVGARPSGASPEGVLDMAGNVWEWVADRYAADYYEWGSDEDPTGPGYGEYRVVRGGAYDGLAEHIRTANRASRPPDQASPNVGFRCCTIGAPEAAFSVDPEEATYDTTFAVDASASSDPNHSTDSIGVRWDWESDGVWDTEWSTGKTATHRYQAPGYYTISLQVIDPDGNTGSTSRLVAAEGEDGWDGDTCASDADCANGFVCVGPLVYPETVCRQFCLTDIECDFPGYTCQWTYSPDSALMRACLPPGR